MAGSELAKLSCLSQNGVASVTYFQRQRNSDQKFIRCKGNKKYDSKVSTSGKFGIAVGSAILAPTSTVDVPRLVDFLYEDLPHVFDDQGIDRTAYDERVQFRDPITKHECLAGYLFNIAFLKTLFSPKLQLHWVKQTGTYEIRARWTVSMEYSLLPWKPELILTGTSIMGINPHNGKFCTHVDLWDSIRDNDYFSVEGFWDVFNQMWIDWIYRTSDFKTRKYQILKRMPSYEVRQYNDSQSDESYKINSNDRKIKTGNIAAVLKFLGESTDEIVEKNEKLLRSSLMEDGLRYKTGCFLASSSKNSGPTPIPWRFPVRNELLVWLDGFTMD